MRMILCWEEVLSTSQSGNRRHPKKGVHFFCQGGNNKKNADFIREKGYQLQKGRDIIGLPVVNLATGEEIGVVADILWSHQELKIRCLVVGDHYLPFADLSSMGTDAITVSGPEVLQDDIELSELKSVNETGGELVLTQDGNNLGTLKDVIFDADEGKLLGYELSTGVVGDLLSGRMVMSPEMVSSWGKEAIIAGFTGIDRGDQNAVSDMPW